MGNEDDSLGYDYDGTRPPRGSDGGLRPASPRDADEERFLENARKSIADLDRVGGKPRSR